MLLAEFKKYKIKGDTNHFLTRFPKLKKSELVVGLSSASSLPSNLLTIIIISPSLSSSSGFFLFRESMCVEAEQVGEEGMENLGLCEKEKSQIMNTQFEKWGNESSKGQLDQICSNDVADSPSLVSICENTAVIGNEHNQFETFVPDIRSGEWSDIGSRPYMEDTHVCIPDLAKTFGCHLFGGEAISFFGVFDGHGGKEAAHFVRDNLPRVIVEDADFPLKLEKVVTRSFVKTDTAFAKKCSLQSALSSGTTALTAMIFGRSLLVANAGDCRAVLSRLGVAVEMSKDHRPCCIKERNRVESLGGYIDDGYLNGQLGVTRALGDWHIEGLKETNEHGGPLSAEPELKLITLTKEDEFLIIGSDGVWDVFTSQNAIDFTRRKLQEHNDVKLCCKEMVEEAMKRGADDNLTVVVICFHAELAPNVVVHRSRVRRSISAEGLQNLKFLLEG